MPRKGLHQGNGFSKNSAVYSTYGPRAPLTTKTRAKHRRYSSTKSKPLTPNCQHSPLMLSLCLSSSSLAHPPSFIFVRQHIINSSSTFEQSSSGWLRVVRQGNQPRLVYNSRLFYRRAIPSIYQDLQFIGLCQIVHCNLCGYTAIEKA